MRQGGGGGQRGRAEGASGVHRRGMSAHRREALIGSRAVDEQRDDATVKSQRTRVEARRPGRGPHSGGRPRECSGG